MSQRPDVRYFSQEALWKPPVDEQVIVADSLISLIPDDVRLVLDAGCGNGVVTNRLVDRWDVVACDISDAALRQVRGARTMIADLVSLPLPSRAFDLVLASDVIEHLPDGVYRPALAEIARVADRYVLVAVPNEELLEVAQVHCPICGHRYHAHLHQRSYGMEDILQLFRPDFGARRIMCSGSRWTFRDPDLVRARRDVSGLDYPFEDAVCPRCASRRGAVEQSQPALQVSRKFEALQAMLCSERLSPLPPRSEVLVLFERGWSGTAEEDPGPAARDDSASVRVPELEGQANPVTYPARPIRIGPGGDATLVALPRAPQAVTIEQGRLDTLEVFDFVRQQFSECRASSSGVVQVPKVPYGPFGCLLRIVGGTRDLSLQAEYATDVTRAEILLRCFGDSPILVELAGKAAGLAALVESLAQKRDELDILLQARDRSITSLSAIADRANDTANRLELQRASLDAQTVRLRAERDRLTILLRAANIPDTEARFPPRDLPEGLPILVLSHMYPRHHHPAGGIFVHDQVKALRDRGVDVRVMSGDPFWINTVNPARAVKAFQNWWRMGGYHWEGYDGVPLIRFPYVVSSRFLPFQAHAFTYTRAALRCLERMADPFEFRLVHAHTAYTDGSAGVAIAQLRGLPLVITEHTGPFSILTRTAYLRRKTQAAINAADRLISVSPSLLSDIYAMIDVKDPTRTVVVPNLVNTDAFKATPRSPDKRIRALWVGHFVQIKRVDRLLSALAEAIQTEPRLQVRLVGDGPLLGEMKALARHLVLDDHVEFVGHVDRADLPLHYVESDFVVISSDRETFGVVAIEGLSCGRRVLTTDCGGPLAVVTDPALGIVVERTDAGLARGLVAMATKVRETEPELIREVALRRFSGLAVTNKLMEIYSELLTGC